MATAKPVSKNLGVGGIAALGKRESLWQDGFRRLIKNRAAVIGASIIILLILAAIFAPVIAVKSFEVQVLADQNKVPAWVVKLFPTMKPYAQISNDYPLGADYVGRDLFSRIIYGARVSLAVAFIGPLISLIIGVICTEQPATIQRPTKESVGFRNRALGTYLGAKNGSSIGRFLR